MAHVKKFKGTVSGSGCNSVFRGSGFNSNVSSTRGSKERTPNNMLMWKKLFKNGNHPRNGRPGTHLVVKGRSSASTHYPTGPRREIIDIV